MLDELFHIHAINVSAQTHTHWSTESTRFLCRLRRARLFKKATCGAATRVMFFHFEVMAVKTTASTHSALGGGEDVLALSKFTQRLVYVAHCPTDTIGQWSQRGPRVFFFK